MLLKLIYSEKATKFCEIFPLLLTACTSKGRGRFRKILWPSQNIWTLFLTSIGSPCSRMVSIKRWILWKQISINLFQKLVKFSSHDFTKNKSQKSQRVWFVCFLLFFCQNILKIRGSFVKYVVLHWTDHK